MNLSSNTNGITFRNEQYIAAHGRAPSGRGAWAFSFDRSGSDLFFINGSKTLVEAKREAAQIAKDRGAATLYVCS